MTAARSRLSVGVLGALGIAVAHWLAYLLAAPDAHTRHQLMSSTGHTYWPLLGAALVAITVGGAGVSLSKRLRRASGHATRSVVATAAILGLLQVSGFVLMEVGERLFFAVHHHGSLVSEPVFWIGIGVQLFFAVAGAVVLKAVLHAARVVRALIRGRARRSATATAQAFVALARIVAPRLEPGVAGFSLRGPPA